MRLLALVNRFNHLAKRASFVLFANVSRMAEIIVVTVKTS